MCIVWFPLFSEFLIHNLILVRADVNRNGEKMGSMWVDKLHSHAQTGRDKRKSQVGINLWVRDWHPQDASELALCDSFASY